jgi:hypothetical protein
MNPEAGLAPPQPVLNVVHLAGIGLERRQAVLERPPRLEPVQVGQEQRRAGPGADEADDEEERDHP